MTTWCYIIDILFYIYNAFHHTPKDTIISTCLNFYDEESIWNEKLRFFDAVGKKAASRRSNAKQKHLEDILAEIEYRDSANIFLPIFVTASLHNIPTSQDGSVTNSQILGNLKLLQKQVLESIRGCVSAEEGKPSL